MPIRALLIDDDSKLADLLRAYLAPHDVVLSHAADGGRGLAALAQGGVDIVILDVMMPGLDGLDVLRRLRQQSAVPVLMLTAKGDEADRVVGLELGADDYLSKPVYPRELLARIRAVLRRAQGAAPSERLVFEDLEMNEEAHEVSRAGRPIDLTPTEFALLRYFLLNPRRVLSKEQILDHVWHYDFGGDASIVETYMSYVRKKVEADGPRLLHTVRGVGYVLRLPKE